MLRRLTVALLFLIQLALVGVGARIAWQSEQTLGGGDVADRLDIPGTGPLASLEAGFDLARAEALKVDPTARLVLVSQQVDWPLDAPESDTPAVAPGGWLTYVFAHEGGGGAGVALSFDIDRLSGSLARAVDVPWDAGLDRARLPLGQLPVESTDAILTVEDAGGAAFRAECPAFRAQTMATLNLSTNQEDEFGGESVASPVAAGTPISAAPGTPVASGQSDGLRGTATWVVTYADRGANDNVALIATVDAVTGSILSMERDLLAGAMACGNVP